MIVLLVQIKPQILVQIKPQKYSYVAHYNKNISNSGGESRVVLELMDLAVTDPEFHFIYD